MAAYSRPVTILSLAPCPSLSLSLSFTLPLPPPPSFSLVVSRCLSRAPSSGLGTGFSFNDGLRAQHSSLKTTLSKDRRKPSTALPKKLAEDMPNYSYYQHARHEAKV